MKISTRPIIRTGLYIKNCHSGCIIPWSSFVPRSQKIGVIIGERNRVAKICSDKQMYDEAVNILSHRFLDNGYPKGVVDRYLFRPIHRRCNINHDKSIKLFLPYLRERFVSQARKIVKSNGFDSNIQIVFRNNLPLSQALQPMRSYRVCSPDCIPCKYADKPKLCYTKFVVYEIICTICDHMYIGETCRTFATRFKEHLCDKNSAIYSHLNYHDVNPKSTDLPLKWKFLDKNVKHPNVRRSIEALHIKRNQGSLMNGCIGRELDI